MKVAEVIEALGKLDPNLQCKLDHFEDGHIDIVGVQIVKHEYEPHEPVVVFCEAPPILGRH